MIKPTNNFFVVDNYNTVPIELLEYCNEYILYDSSTNEETVSLLSLKGILYKKIPRTGHNISTYFRFFYEHYDNLPEIMVLTKGHMLGRHCSKVFFDRVYDNQYFTALFDRTGLKGLTEIPLASENWFIEKVSSGGVVTDRPQKYFFDALELLNFVFEIDTKPTYWCFAPGGCYIVTRSQVLKYSKNFWINMHKIVSYDIYVDNCPAEAHYVERILPIIFSKTLKEKEYMNDLELFDQYLKRIAMEFEKNKNNLILHDKKSKRNIMNIVKGIVCGVRNKK